MKSASSLIPVFATVVLHAALVTLIITGLNSEQKKAEPPRPVPIQLLQEQATPSAPPAPLPAVSDVSPSPPQLPRKKQPEPKPRAAPKPAQPPREQKPAIVKAPDLMMSLPSDSNTTAAPPQSRSVTVPPITAPAPSVKHGVFVDPSYAAVETEKWYPKQARRFGDEGSAVVHVTVSPAGRAEKVELKKSSGNPLLDSAAIGLAKSLKYRPATLDGTPVSDSFDMPVEFKLKD